MKKWTQRFSGLALLVMVSVATLVLMSVPLALVLPPLPPFPGH